MTCTITDEELAAAAAEEMVAEAEAINRWTRLKRTYGDDVRRLYPLAIDSTGAARIAADLLCALHRKNGSIPAFELRHLDPKNRAAAMRLIDCMATPSIIPDAGLTVDPNGDPLLTVGQIGRLIHEDVAA
ncbi:hypothetical protein [Falsirhodobacter sp. alg1]|uniref:hypothetical protein n=1 Tax=Falsirhodobacter sp. alg1 TaxID=1472418 RepID=UPI0005EDF99C|nr:hypothetical protein [Falsirhodobacter sp. alg1]